MLMRYLILAIRLMIYKVREKLDRQLKGFCGDGGALRDVLS